MEDALRSLRKNEQNLHGRWCPRCGAQPGSARAPVEKESSWTKKVPVHIVDMVFVTSLWLPNMRARRNECVSYKVRPNQALGMRTLVSKVILSSKESVEPD
jgi:hypothetical protein